MSEHDAIIQDLEIMAGAIRYRRWILSQFLPHLGRRVVELGAGIGTFTSQLLDREQVIAVDVTPACVDYLRRRFAGDPRVLPVLMDASSPSLRDLGRHRPDTVVCINVLEHIADDRAALRNMFDILPPGGKLALLVPSHPALHGSIDRLVGHVRRYRKRELLDKLRETGFSVCDLHYMNSIAVPGWFLNNRILKRAAESPHQVMVFDRFVVPWLSMVETAIHPPFGLSLVAIGRKE